MFSAPNYYFIAISKLFNDEISIQPSVVKIQKGQLWTNSDAKRIFTSRTI